jgi:ribosomal protein L37AE/L43A
MVANDWLVRPRIECPKCGQQEVVWAKNELWCLNCDNKFTSGSARGVVNGTKNQ